jgi:hypothetical protein
MPRRISAVPQCRKPMQTQRMGRLKKGSSMLLETAKRNDLARFRLNTPQLKR